MELGGCFPGVGVMAVFLCPACGGHAFRLSADLEQAHCENCRLPLGSWQELRVRIKRKLSLRVVKPRDPDSAGIFLFFGPCTSALLHCCHYPVAEIVA